jgi:hypothetical protein
METGPVSSPAGPHGKMADMGKMADLLLAIGEARPGSCTRT